MTQSQLHDLDFHQWAQQQANLLKARHFAELDTDHLIEELESMSASERRELTNRMAVLLAHLLKWQYQSDRRTASWQATIKVQRIDVEMVLCESPSLRPRLPEFVDRAYPKAVLLAVKETGLREEDFPAGPPFGAAEILNPDFWPE